jgi:transposase InsO family protein/transposase-like protein
MGRQGYPPEFRRRVLDLIEAGRKVADVARDLGISTQTIYNWRQQDRIDKGLEPGLSSGERAELLAARRRIAQLESELKIARRAMELLKDVKPPKVRYAAIKIMAAEKLPIQSACRILDVSESGFYAWQNRPPSERAIRHAWLTDLATEIHDASRQTYGSIRVHAELTQGRGVDVGLHQVALVMRRAGLKGLLGRRKRPRIERPDTIALDLVDRSFARSQRDQLWVTDITEHSTREGRLYCCVVLDVFSRRVVGWSIDASPTAGLVTNALGMAINSRNPDPGTLIHSDQGTQFTSWAFTHRAKTSGLVPSMGSIGDCYDNAMIESFWSRMQVELLDGQRWLTRVQLANAIFEYLEVFHNRQRRHSALQMLTPIEFEQRQIRTVA